MISPVLMPHSYSDIDTLRKRLVKTFPDSQVPSLASQ